MWLRDAGVAIPTYNVEEPRVPLLLNKQLNSKKQGELDFVVEYAGNMLPIEVKSGKDYERHNALTNVMENEEYAVPMAYVFCQENVRTKGRVTYYPIYMIAFFEQIQAEEKVYKFDFVGL